MTHIKNFNDRITSRNRSSKNILAITNKGVFMEFTGRSIPGVCRILRKDFDKAGKWSANFWKCELEDDVISATHTQDFGLCRYFKSETWDEVVSEFLGLFEGLDNPAWREAAQQFIRATYTKTAERLDVEEDEFENNHLPELVEAQEALAIAQEAASAAKLEVKQLIEAKRLRQEAAELKRKTEEISSRLKNKGSMSLEELQELYNNL